MQEPATSSHYEDQFWNLFKMYEDQNEAIVNLIHSKALSHLTSMSMTIDIQQFKTGKGSVTNSELIAYITETKASLRLIHNNLAMVVYNQLGFSKALRGYVVQCEKQFDAKIAFDDQTSLNSVQNFSGLKQLNMLRLHQGILSYLVCKKAASKLSCSITEHNSFLTFSYEVQEKKIVMKNEQIEDFAFETEKSLLTRIKVMQGGLDSNSNWTNAVNFSIPF